MTKTYKVSAPVGNTVAPNESMDEAALRKFAQQITPQKEWKEKFEKDPIEDVLEALSRGGYQIEELWND